jgi:REP element-mobilizing transposase RayT
MSLQPAASMARPLRPQFADAIYHVISRGNARQPVFTDPHEGELFLAIASRVTARFGWRVLAYCLMTNHYHLCVVTPEPTLARGMRDINGQYAQAFNRRHDRVGHVFQGRYQGILVERHSQLLELVRYIALNPVRGGLCRDPAEWRWSSYRAVTGRGTTLPVDSDFVLRAFGRERAAAILRYRAFVQAGLRDAVDGGPSANPVIAGSDEFAGSVIGALPEQSSEVPRRQRTKHSLRYYEEAEDGRDAGIRLAFASGHYSLAQIGRHFGLHYSTVSRICRDERLAIRRVGPAPAAGELTRVGAVTQDLAQTADPRPDPERPGTNRQFKT